MPPCVWTASGPVAGGLAFAAAAVALQHIAAEELSLQAGHVHHEPPALEGFQRGVGLAGQSRVGHEQRVQIAHHHAGIGSGQVAAHQARLLQRDGLAEHAVGMAHGGLHRCLDAVGVADVAADGAQVEACTGGEGGVGRQQCRVGPPVHRQAVGVGGAADVVAQRKGAHAGDHRAQRLAGDVFPHRARLALRGAAVGALLRQGGGGHRGGEDRVAVVAVVSGAAGPVELVAAEGDGLPVHQVGSACAVPAGPGRWGAGAGGAGGAARTGALAAQPVRPDRCPGPAAALRDRRADRHPHRAAVLRRVPRPARGRSDVALPGAVPAAGGRAVRTTCIPPAITARRCTTRSGGRRASTPGWRRWCAAQAGACWSRWCCTAARAIRPSPRPRRSACRPCCRRWRKASKSALPQHRPTIGLCPAPSRPKPCC